MLGPATYGHQRRYVSIVADTGRWDGFQHRPGDIVISTPSKCGTTWTQMLVALLIFDGPDFPDKLTRISPWLDLDAAPKVEVWERLAAQTHRRFIKTHSPLDGLPLDERVTYIVVGRDPRDVLLSMAAHLENLNYDDLIPRLIATVGREEVERRLAGRLPLGSLAEAVAVPPGSDHTTPGPRHIAQHLAGAWRLRTEANLLLLHYADLQRDCVGELRRIAAALGIEVDQEQAARLATHAEFAQMRRRASDVAPEIDNQNWRSNEDFFREGRLGAWKTAFDREALQTYEKQITADHADEDFLRWMHGGMCGTSWRV